MIVALGSDHGGFSLRKPVVDATSSSGRQLHDIGTFEKLLLIILMLQRLLQKQSYLGKPCAVY